MLGGKVQQQRRTDGPRLLSEQVLVKVNDVITEVRRDDLEVDRDLLRDLQLGRSGSVVAGLERERTNGKLDDEKSEAAETKTAYGEELER